MGVLFALFAVCSWGRKAGNRLSYPIILHVKCKDRTLVNVRLMPDRVEKWGTYWSDTTGISVKNEIIKRHTRTARPLRSDEFVKRLEALTGKSLAPGKSGRKAYKGK
jgi:hypothetical protein